MSIQKIFQEAKSWIIEQLSALYTQIEPGLIYLEKNVPAAVIALAQSLLIGAEAGTPWPTLEDNLIAQAEKEGVILAKEAATVALNTAQNNLIATGTPHLDVIPPVPATPTVSADAGETSPADSDAELKVAAI